MASSKWPVWLKKRKNPKKKDGSPGTISFTLQWRDEQTGKDRFESLGPSTTEEEAEKKRVEKEIQLNRRTTEVRVEAVEPGQLTTMLQDICGPRARNQELDLRVRVELPELGISEILPMRVPLEILPYWATTHEHPNEEGLCQSVLFDLLLRANSFLDEVNLEGVSKADDNIGWTSEYSAWEQRLIQHLYETEFGCPGAHATAPPPAEAATAPIATPAVTHSPLSSSRLSTNAFTMSEETEPDYPRLANPLQRGQMWPADEDDTGSDDAP